MQLKIKVVPFVQKLTPDLYLNAQEYFRLVVLQESECRHYVHHTHWTCFTNVDKQIYLLYKCDLACWFDKLFHLRNGSYEQAFHLYGRTDCECLFL